MCVTIYIYISHLIKCFYCFRMYVTRDEIVIAFNGNDSLSGLTTYSHFPFFNNVAFNQSVFTCTVGKQPANEPSITDDEQRVDK